MTPPDPTVVMVRSTVRWCAVALVPLALAGVLWHGISGGVCAAAGVLVVTAFFALGVLGVNLITTAAPGLAVVGAYAVYVSQLMALMLVIVVGRDYVRLDRPAFAFGAVAGTMVWQIAHSRAFLRTRQPVHTPIARQEET